MKTATLMGVVCLVLGFPGVQAKAQEIDVSKRVHCVDYTPLDPYVEVRGFLALEGTAPSLTAKGDLRIMLGSASPGTSLYFQGRVVDDGRFNFAELYPERQ